MTVRALREPGGTAVGEAVRHILLDPDHEGIDAHAELFLYEAARAQLVAEVIEPALACGEVVLCDRFCDSSTAYQGHGRGLPIDEVIGLNAVATGGCGGSRCAGHRHR
jgi:dTMP kinase